MLSIQTQEKIAVNYSDLVCLKYGIFISCLYICVMFVFRPAWAKSSTNTEWVNCILRFLFLLTFLNDRVAKAGEVARYRFKEFCVSQVSHFSSRSHGANVGPMYVHLKILFTGFIVTDLNPSSDNWWDHKLQNMLNHMSKLKMILEVYSTYFIVFYLFFFWHHHGQCYRHPHKRSKVNHNDVKGLSSDHNTICDPKTITPVSKSEPQIVTTRYQVSDDEVFFVPYSHFNIVVQLCLLLARKVVGPMFGSLILTNMRKVMMPLLKSSSPKRRTIA